ncbi:eukaryotic rRNA processing protein EBP2 [Skeletonema marinoi]|uniref:Eukaryotic rRNA processing protein EBP2 n=1 Tax=Skeletonema marinoi TaxID=267567 RepID=A0AAD8Y554_9STRA|nr:eukaryotic rRNA processing protein EBP2 [Skeletonema marinoi]
MAAKKSRKSKIAKEEVVADVPPPTTSSTKKKKKAKATTTTATAVSDEVKSSKKKKKQQKVVEPEPQSESDDDDMKLTLEALDDISDESGDEEAENNGEEVGDEAVDEATARLRQMIEDGTFDGLLKQNKKKGKKNDVEEEEEDLEEEELDVSMNDEVEDDDEEEEDNEEEEEVKDDNNASDDESEEEEAETEQSSKQLTQAIALAAALEGTDRHLPWPETFTVVPPTPLPFGPVNDDDDVGGKKRKRSEESDDDEEEEYVDVHDDLKREVAFYDNAMEAVRMARSHCENAGIPFTRPEDFFAEMIKTDGKKAHMSAVEDWKKSAEQGRGRLGGKVHDMDADEDQLRGLGGGGPNNKRMNADKRYGFGGKRGRFKQNDPKDLNDMSGLSRGVALLVDKRLRIRLERCHCRYDIGSVRRGFSPVAETVEENGGLGEVLRTDGINSTLFVGLGILSTAMACQHSAFIVANSLEDKTRSRWSWVTKQSIGVSAILCLILGIFGYLGFLVQADGARILLAFTMFFTYPMESFVARHVLIMLIHNGDMDAKGGCTLENESRVEEEELGDEGGGGEGDDLTVSTSRSIIEGGGLLCMNRRQTWTLLVYLSTLLPALIFNDIGPVLSLTGAIGGGCIAYIGPGLVYLGVNGEDFLNAILARLERWRGTKDVNNNSGSGGVTEEDLPVDGDASLEIDATTSIDAYERIVSGSKPFGIILVFSLFGALLPTREQHT